ncbi:GNAT family N-acetyltransferase [Pseudothermotoga sp. U03pept]|uniref:GNAT family N-acetyltransferase n=1 Tax=Pseudothermotoga sp. U03pept TaxID=3447012 RepID=UPI003F10272C
MEGLIIREVRLSDAVQIVNFKKMVSQESKFLLTCPDEVEDLIDQRRMITLYLGDPRRIFLVAEYFGEIVGMITLYGSNRRRIVHRGELGITVRRDFWGKGIGTSLMHNCLAIAKQKGFKKIQLEVMANNERAIRLYKKFGFEVEGVMKRAVCVDGEYIDLVMMGRWLGD